jgi:hypothetical protein
MSLYEEILAIAENYMGPAAEDYIRRRIRIVQRGEDPETIRVDKIPRLAAGIEMTAKMYLAKAKADAFRDEILALEDRRQ